MEVVGGSVGAGGDEVVVDGIGGDVVVGAGNVDVGTAGGGTGGDAATTVVVVSGATPGGFDVGPNVEVGVGGG